MNFISPQNCPEGQINPYEGHPNSIRFRRNTESKELGTPQLFNFIIDNLSNAKTLRVREGSRSQSLGIKWMGASLRLRTLELPLLEGMCIDVAPRTGYGLRHNAYDYGGSPMTTPRLRKLRLENCWLPFSPATLVSLELIRSFRPQEDTLPPVSLFLDLLLQCANLRDLSLVEYMPQLPTLNDEERLPNVINLPSLRVLVVWAPLPKILSFWSYIKIPESTFMSIGCDLFTVRADMYAFDQGGEVVQCYTDVRRMDLLRSLGDHVRADPALTQVPISGVSILEGHDGVEILVLELWTTLPFTPPHLRDQALRPLFFMEKHSPRFTVAFDAWPFTITSDYGGFIAALDVVWSSFPLHSIRTLEIGAASPYAARQWHDILARFSQVESLALEKVSRSFVLGAFSKDLAAPNNLLLPKMRSLTIDIIKFREFKELCGDQKKVPGMDLEEFLDVLQHRSQEGSPLTSLVIKELSPHGAHPRDMEEFFQRLDSIVPQRRVGTYISHLPSMYEGWSDAREEEEVQADEQREGPPP